MNPYLAAWLPNIIMGTAGARSSLAGRALTQCPSAARDVAASPRSPLSPPFLRGSFPVGAPAASDDQQSNSRLQLFNAQSCAQHYARRSVRRVAQATPPGDGHARHRRHAGPSRRPVCPMCRRGVGNGTYTLNRNAAPAAGPNARPSRRRRFPAATPNPTASDRTDLPRARRRDAAADSARRSSDAGADSRADRRADARARLRRRHLRQVERQSRARPAERRDRQRSHLLRRRRDRRRDRAHFDGDPDDHDHGPSVSRQSRAQLGADGRRHHFRHRRADGEADQRQRRERRRRAARPGSLFGRATCTPTPTEPRTASIRT